MPHATQKKGEGRWFEKAASVRAVTEPEGALTTCERGGKRRKRRTRRTDQLKEDRLGRRDERAGVAHALVGVVG